MLRGWRAGNYGAILVAAFGLQGSPCLQAGEPIQFNIQGEAASASLHEFSEQSHLQLLYSMAAIGEQRTHQVIGSFEPQAALDLLLEGTNLTTHRVDEKTWAVMPCDPTSLSKDTVVVHPPAQSADPREGSALLPRNSLAAKSLQSTVVVHPLMESVLGGHPIQMDSEDIARSGFTAIQDVFRALPQNFGGGPADDIRHNGQETPTNTGRGSSINLRGLGAHSTVILINGRRIAPSGGEGAFVDISNIPLSAVSRIDVVPESASARYGSDGVGGVVDIRLRDHMNGESFVTTTGADTVGGSREYQVAPAIGRVWSRGDASLFLEYYQRDPLPASARSQGNSDLRANGGNDYDTPYSDPGTIIVGNQTWAIPNGQDGRALSAADLTSGTSNLEALLRGADLIAGQRRWSVASNLHFSWSDTETLFMEVLGSDRLAQQRSPGVRLELTVPSSNPFYVNPLGGTEPVKVAYDFLDDLGPSIADVAVQTFNIAAGARFEYENDWRLQIYDAWALERERVHQDGLVDNNALAKALSATDPATAFNPFGAGSHTSPSTLAAIRTAASFRSVSDLASMNLVAEGPGFALPAGTVWLAAGCDFRRQSFWSLSSEPPDSPQEGAFHQRQVASGFTQLRLPLLERAETPRASLDKVTASVALRAESYNDIGFVTTPTLQLSWMHGPSLTMRANWGRYASPPHLADLDVSSNGVALVSLPDPHAPSGFSRALLLFGKNPNLRPEAARSWSFGVDMAPLTVPGFTLSATYFDILSYDRIQSVAFTEELLNNPAYAELITRMPTPSQQAAACKTALFLGVEGDCTKTPIEAIGDIRIRNIATLSTQGIDVLAKDRFASPIGTWEGQFSGTYLLKYTQEATHATAPEDLLNTQDNPISVRMRGSVSWRYGKVESTVFINHTGRYRDVLSQPSRPVASWTTMDFQINYLTQVGLFKESRLSVTVQNAFNRPPPFLNNVLGIGYDPENASLLGRYVRFRIAFAR